MHERNQSYSSKEINTEGIIYQHQMEEGDLVKADIPEIILTKWQQIIDIIADIFDVPSALIMRVKPPYIEVLISSKTEENPYHIGEKEHLAGLYCNTVMIKRDKLLVPNALKDEVWKDNPDVKLNMIAYLGYPLSWPNGQIFGTICVLDTKENQFSKKYEQILSTFKDIINSYLEQVYIHQKLENEIKSKNRLEQSLKQQRDYQETVNEILRHDLSNSLTLISGYLDLFEVEKDQEEIKTKIMAALKSIHEIIEKAQKLSEITDIDIEEREMMEKNFQYLVDKYPIEINVTGKCSLISSVPILSALDNLIDNAIRHGKTDKISINLSETGSVCNIKVKDYGKGIPQEIREKVFEKGFSYGETGNTGLGLYIVKTVVEQLNGKVTIRDNEPRGTIVNIELPKE